MKAKKPTHLKAKRGKRKLIAVRREVLKNEPWYASAAMRMGIKAAGQADKSASVAKDNRP